MSLGSQTPPRLVGTYVHAVTTYLPGASVGAYGYGPKKPSELVCLGVAGLISWRVGLAPVPNQTWSSRDP